MASEEARSFPQLPAGVWWGIRNQFKKSVPASLSDSFLATLLNVKPAAAKAYRLELRKLGIVDEKGKPGDLAYDLRDDAKYKAAALTILKSVYPEDLLSIAPPPNPERKQVISWFMNAAKLGEGSAGNRAAFYCLLASGELEGSESTKPKRAATSARNAGGTPKAKATKAQDPPGEGRRAPAHFSPSIQLNVEIHISSDATVAQIDAIFGSMAKHLQPKS